MPEVRNEVAGDLQLLGKKRAIQLWTEQVSGPQARSDEKILTGLIAFWLPDIHTHEQCREEYPLRVRRQTTLWT